MNDQSRIDWQAMHDQLRAAASTLDQRPTAADAEALLVRRARELARPYEDTEGAEEEIELLAFMLGGERYAVAATLIVEVVPLEDVVRVPLTPSFLLGVVNHRGNALPVVDVARLAGMSAGDGARDELVVVRAGDQAFGIAVDEVEDVTRCAAAHLAPVRPGDRAGFVRPVRGRLLSVLDVEALAAGGQLEVNEDLRMEQVDQGREVS